jgi:hypothetical protein
VAERQCGSSSAEALLAIAAAVIGAAAIAAAAIATVHSPCQLRLLLQLGGGSISRQPWTAQLCAQHTHPGKQLLPGQQQHPGVPGNVGLQLLRLLHDAHPLQAIAAAAAAAAAAATAAAAAAAAAAVWPGGWLPRQRLPLLLVLVLLPLVAWLCGECVMRMAACDRTRSRIS